jgi:protein required for attachment to host cells
MGSPKKMILVEKGLIKEPLIIAIPEVCGEVKKSSKKDLKRTINEMGGKSRI